jgi:hypothetical protein
MGIREDGLERHITKISLEARRKRANPRRKTPKKNNGAN